MTGFGAGRASAGEEEVAVELKTVNHKFCEVKVRLPRELASLEVALVKRVKERIARGAVDVTLKRGVSGVPATFPSVDLALALEYRRVLSELAASLDLPNQLRVQDIAFQPGVLRMEERGVDVERAQQAATTALDQALDALTQMRETEGRAMRADLETRLSLVESITAEVKRLCPEAVAEYRARLEERIAELVRGAADPARLAQEVAIFAERTDVEEEMTRLASHLAQFRELLVSPEPSGRKMDFLVQEMNREVNTTGSKSQHPGIASRIVALKAELERIREQVQNVE